MEHSFCGCTLRAARSGLQACKGIGFDAFRLGMDMGNYTKQIEAREERKERDKTSRETLGKFFYDLAKLSFAGLVVGCFTLNEEGKLFMLAVASGGVALTIVFSRIGFIILKNKK